MLIKHLEHHRTQHISWLRAAVLGANDGIISTASLIIAIAAAHTEHNTLIIAAIAAVVAGAMSMAAGEYVSVSSQADNEKAELEVERRELEINWEDETKELTQIYVKRGLEPALAKQVAQQLMAHDALGAHARDEIGITEVMAARPLQAAIFSAASFSIGGFLPLAVTLLAAPHHIITAISVSALISLGLLGGIAAKIGGAKMTQGVTRVTFWGLLAMSVSAGVGYLFGV